MADAAGFVGFLDYVCRLSWLFFKAVTATSDGGRVYVEGRRWRLFGSGNRTLRKVLAAEYCKAGWGLGFGVISITESG